MKGEFEVTETRDFGLIKLEGFLEDLTGGYQKFQDKNVEVILTFVPVSPNQYNMSVMGYSQGIPVLATDRIMIPQSIVQELQSYKVGQEVEIDFGIEKVWKESVKLAS